MSEGSCCKKSGRMRAPTDVPRPTQAVSPALSPMSHTLTSTSNRTVGAHIDLPSPLHSYPSITGHDLMAMFPPKSPQTVRTNGGASCTVFAQQERAFLSNPHKLPNPPTVGHRVTDHANPNESTKATAPQAPTTAMSLKGKCVVKAGIMCY